MMNPGEVLIDSESVYRSKLAGEISNPGYGQNMSPNVLVYS